MKDINMILNKYIPKRISLINSNNGHNYIGCVVYDKGRRSCILCVWL